jgi:hypothetical protein
LSQKRPVTTEKKIGDCPRSKVSKTLEAARVFQRPHIETRDLRAGQDASQSATLDEPSVDTRSTARAQRARRRSPEGASTTRSSPSRVVAIAFEAADRFFV